MKGRLHLIGWDLFYMDWVTVIMLGEIEWYLGKVARFEELFGA